MVDGSSVCVGLEHACVERNISHRNSGEQERGGGGGERLVSHVKQAQIALGRRGYRSMHPWVGTAAPAHPRSITHVAPSSPSMGCSRLASPHVHYTSLLLLPNVHVSCRQNLLRGIEKMCN